MKKTRFLWIRDLPPKCRDSDLRAALERHGSVQKIRLFKKGDTRDAIVSFVDIKSATAVINSENKLNNTLLKVEYCDSSDFSGIINNAHRASESSHIITNAVHKSDKDQYVRNLLQKSSNYTHPISSNVHLGRGPLIFKRAKNNSSHGITNNQVLNPVLRPVQNSTLNSRSSSIGLRGLKISDLPPASKVSDAHLRQSLFTEFRRCGRIQSVVIPSVNGSSAVGDGSNLSRLAIVTFRRSEEAEYAYQAILSGSKVLFASPVSVELHPGFTSTNGNSIEDMSGKRSSVLSFNTATRPLSAATSTNQLAYNKSHTMRSIEDQLYVPNNTVSSSNKLPTRTLHVGGLTIGPTGPVTAEQLTTAFRKFGDIINVQLLRPSSQSALIQFAEMRGSIRAMNAHTRDPLRLGGRPLTLAYTPSTPATSLWISDLPSSLSSLTGEEILHNFSQIVPVQEIALINRTDQARHKQFKASANSTLTPNHYAAYIRLASTDHAIRLLSELRCDKHFVPNQHNQSNGVAAISTTTTSNGRSSRRPIIAVDFASPRQSNVVSSLQLSAARSSLNSHRIKIISASNVDQWNSRSNSSVSNLNAPIASSANTILTSCYDDTNSNNKSIHSKKLLNCNSSINDSSNRITSFKSVVSQRATSQTNSNYHSLSTDRSSAAIVRQKDNGHMKRRSFNAKRLNKQNKETNLHPYQEYGSRLKQPRDTSPSALSTTSDSSSSTCSSVSSDSSTSSTVSSTSLSESSLTSSSATSLTHNSPPSQCISRTSNSHMRHPKVSLPHRTRIGKPLELISSKKLKYEPRVTGESPNTVKGKQSDKKNFSLDSLASKSGSNTWGNDTSDSTTIMHQPLRVVTTTSSTTLSPSRNSAASSGDLSSPGASFHTTNGPSNVKTPNLNDSGCYNQTSILNQTLTQNVSFKSANSAVSEFKVSPTSRACSVSASSGVSSGGPSFGSANSSGGGSTGSSPLNIANSLSSHGQPLIGVISKCGNITTTHQKLTTLSPLVKRGENEVVQPRSSIDDFDTLKQCPTTYSSSGSLKLHLTSSSALPTSSSPSNYSNLCCTTTTPLTVSIKLSGSRQSQSTRLVSPSCLSTEIMHSNVDKTMHTSLTPAPVSAPPHGRKTSKHPSTETRRKSDSIDVSTSDTIGSSTDWWTSSTPVYESMYDKIKRRTNKEAEERRKRQVEAFAVREKKHQRQQKKEQLPRSPLANNIPFTPESFGSEHSEKTAVTCSSEKSRHSSSALSRMDNMNSPHHDLCSKNEVPCHWSQNQSHICHMNSGLDSDSHLSRRLSRRETRTKRRHSAVSSFSSSLSSEEDQNSNSPPGTLTRLSLGMRFPVSATYHECIRPSKLGTHKAPQVSEPENDEALSQLSSSLSCSSSDEKLENTKTNTLSGQKLFANMKTTHHPSSCYASSAITTTLSTTRNIATVAGKHGQNCSIHTGVSSSDCTLNENRKLYPHNKSLKRLKSSNNCESLKHRRRSQHQVQSKNDTFMRNSTKRQYGRMYSSNCTTDSYPHKRKCPTANDTSSHNFQLSDPHTDVMMTSPKPSYRHRVRSPKPYFSDDATILDSEAEDNKGSFISGSDSVSHTTGTSDRHSLKDSAYHRGHHHHHRHMSPAGQSGTDESNVFELDSHHIRSPNSIPNHRSVGSVNHQSNIPNTTPLNVDTVNYEYTTNDRTSKRKKFLTSPFPLCSISNPKSMQVDGGDAVVFDTLIDSDRFSVNSKSTVSTEPMEQCELNDDSPGLKFTDDEDVDGEWHSGIPSSSPHLVHLDFDDDDDVDQECEVDKKPDTVSTIFQPEPSIAHVSSSPIQMLSNSLLESSEDEKINDSFTEQEQSQTTQSPGKAQSNSIKIESKSHLFSDITNLPNFESSISKISPLQGDSDRQDIVTARTDIPQPSLKLKPSDEICDPVNSPFDQKKVDQHLHDVASAQADEEVDKTSLKISDSPILDTKSPFEVSIFTGTTILPVSITATSPVVSHTVTVTNCNSLSLPSVITAVTNSLKSVNSSTSSPVPLDTLTDCSNLTVNSQKCVTQLVPVVFDSTVPITLSQTTMVSSIMASTTPTVPVGVATNQGIEGKSNLIEKSSENVLQTQSTARQTTQNPAKLLSSANSTVTSTSSASMVYAPQLTEAHDIKRYVQSVIERVKAERVEENQQAAAAAAQCHQHHPSTVSTSSLTSPNCSLTTTQLSRANGEHTNGTSVNVSAGRRSANSQRRSLLVTASTCSSVKSNSLVKYPKWLSNLGTANSVVVPITNTTTTATFATFEHGGNTISNLCSPTETVQSVPAATSCAAVTSNIIVTSDIHMPSIPGVNACAPLCPQVIQQNVTQRVTRQAANSVVISNPPNSVKRTTDPHISIDVSLSSANARRQRRTENKVSVVTTTSTMKDNTTHVFTVSPQILTTVVAPTHLPSTITSVSQKPIHKTCDSDESIQPTPLSTTNATTILTNARNKKSSNTLIDPYEPNFDEESPVGFDPSQLHHRATPPTCTSPSPISRKPVSVSNNVTVTTNVSMPSVTTNSNAKSTPQIAATLPTGTDITSSIQNSTAFATDCVTTSSSVTSTCVTSGTIDTVDEVIRDVCAGQFDVQSYLNNWRSYPGTAATTTSVITQSFKPTYVPTSASDGVSHVSNVQPTSSIATTVCSTRTTMPSNPPTAANTMAFPIPGEPVVAAVTIPVSSNQGSSKINNGGKNGANNLVNIGTGNALLNTLLAALQLIPGSQVTVTGPAAAATVVGNLGVNNQGAISATTITLPVNAARQAAANIKAAVLSATSGNINCISAQTTNDLPANTQHTSSPAITTAAAVTSCNSKLTTTTTTVSLNSSLGLEPSLIYSQTNNPTIQIRPVIIQNNKTQVPVSNLIISNELTGSNNNHNASNSVTFPNRVPYANPTPDVASNDRASVKTVSVKNPPAIPVSSTYKTPLKSFDPTSDSMVVVSDTLEQLTPFTSISVTTGRHTNTTNITTYTPTSINQAIFSQQKRNSCTLKTSNAHLSSLLTNSPHTVQTRVTSNVSQTASTTSVSPHPSLLSPPAASLPNPVMQNLIDHLAAGVEPSVAVAIVHAALNGTGLRRGMADSATESQLNPYLRQIIQQLMDNRANNGNPMKQPIVINHSESAEVHLNNSSVTSTVAVPLTTIPITVAATLNVACKTTTTASASANLTPIIHRTISPSLTQSIPVNPFTSPICVNTIDSDVASLDFNTTKNAIISPPIVTPRQQPLETVTADVPNSKLDTLLWSSVGSSYPLVWQGRLSLKNTETRVALHYIQGNHNLLNACMTLLASGGGGQPQLSLVASGGPLRIVQRMRLEPAQLEGVQRKINQEGASCTCLALPTGITPTEVVQQTQILNDNFIRYMQEKMAAGIINVGHPDYQQGLYVVHIFPPCEFSHTQLNFAAPDLHRRVLQANQSHLLVVITTV